MLHANAPALRAQGIHYPTFEAGNSFHHGLFRIAAAKGADGIGKTLGPAILAHAEGATTVISTENFNWNPTPERIGAVRAYFEAEFDEITVLLYLRNFYAYLNAWYCEHVQGFENQASLLPRGFLNDRRIDRARYSRTVALWQEMFGRSAVTVRLYQRSALVRQDIFWDAMSVIDPGFRPGDLQMVAQGNPSMDFAALSLQRAFNSAARIGDRRLHADIGRAVRTASRRFTDARRPSQITPPAAAAVDRAAAEDAPLLARLVGPELAATVYARPDPDFFPDAALQAACADWVAQELQPKAGDA